MSDKRQWDTILDWHDKLMSSSPREYHMVKGVSFDGRQVRMLTQPAAMQLCQHQLCWHALRPYLTYEATLMRAST